MSPTSAFRLAVANFARTKWFRKHGPRIMPPLERFFSAVSGGRLIASGVVMPALLLISTGAKTGERRENELMCVPDGEDWLITGSNFAGPKHPGWTYNLLAHPDAEIKYRGEIIPVTATRVPKADVEATWVKLQAQWPHYREYEEASGRVLRIFRLTRRA